MQEQKLQIPAQLFNFFWGVHTEHHADNRAIEKYRRAKAKDNQCFFKTARRIVIENLCFTTKLNNLVLSVNKARCMTSNQRKKLNF